MVLFIITYVFYFSWMGNRLFSGTIEGVQSFSTLPDAFFYMVVLLTTSNYPDVMMPSYSDSRINSIFFITFLVIGLFLLMNLLLAIFYAKYQERADDSIDKSRETRNKFLYELFITFDREGDGYINKKQTYEYMTEIDALVKNQDKKADQEELMSNMQFEQLFKVMDTDGSGSICPDEVESLLQAYEMWTYEHTYKQTMEELYADIDNE